jgi:hypothetical protein
MSDTENDEDFKRAIALSLMSPDPDSHPPYVNILSSDEEEDDDLDRPLTARPITSARANTGKKSSPFAERSQEVVIDSSTPSQVFRGAETHAPPMSSGVLGLNRKQMEDERLARAAMRNRGEQDASMTATPPRKRKASTSPASSRDRVRLVKESSRNSPKSFPTTKTKRDFRASADATSAIPRKGTFNLAQPHNKAFETRITQPNEHSISSPSSPRSTSDTTAKAQEQVSATKLPQSFNLSSIQYPDGVVKKTWAFGYNRQGDDIKIEEVFQKNDLEIAVLSAFQLDADWVMSKLNSTTKVVWVLQAKDEAQVSNINLPLLVALNRISACVCRHKVLTQVVPCLIYPSGLSTYVACGGLLDFLSHFTPIDVSHLLHQ